MQKRKLQLKQRDILHYRNNDFGVSPKSEVFETNCNILKSSTFRTSWKSGIIGSRREQENYVSFTFVFVSIVDMNA